MLNTYNFLILLWIIPHISCQIWSSPYFEQPPDQVLTTKYNAEFDELTGSQLIWVHEQLKVPFPIAIVNYDGPGSVTLGAYTRGYNTDIDIQIKRGTEDDKRFIVTVNKEQDYEKMSDYIYRFGITVTEGAYTQTYFLHLIVVNLVDTAPTIEYDAPCTIEELLPAGRTDCIFTVSVDDGFTFASSFVTWDNYVTAVLFEDDELNSLFEFELRDTSDNYAFFYLSLKKILHYEDKPFYNFRTYFENSEGYKSSVLTIVELIDVPSMPPIWTIPFTIQTFNEKEFRYFDVTAIDGDTGIDDEINFRIEFDKDDEEKYQDLIKLTKQSKNVARISVPQEGIDRDQLKQEIFRFTIIAYKVTDDGTVLETPSSGLIVITDINDHLPEISMFDEDGVEMIEITIKILEEKFLTLPIDQIIVDDKDSGNNAMYYVKLGHDDDIPYSEPFNIVPGNGYQRSEFFKIDVIQNEGYLDYENEIWRSFEIYMIATETENEDRYTKKIIKIDLINWNDEIPIFQEDKDGEYFAEVSEDIGEGEFILKVLAIDADVGDKVTHTILGSLAELLYMDPETGDIFTKKSNTFDYEKQEQIILQVMAEDELTTDTIGEVTHRVYAQVTIDITDVNDETPQIKMPATPQIEENIQGGSIVTSDIEAYDPDTNAQLKFEIDWENSAATKSGRKVDAIHYMNCFTIEEIAGENNVVWGRLTVNTAFVIPGIVDIDYEKFEVLYLSIRVTDEKQVKGIGYAVAQLTIRIIDVNDNKPMFVNDSELTVRNVLEEARTGTQIGTIFAEDLDGPDWNEITYSIIPVNENVPKNWIEIDNKGVIRVQEDQAIDCDKPPREFLEYYVTLADIDFTTTEKIIINIIDTNNKFPQISDFDNTIYVKENIKNGEPLTTIIATDEDRDPEHRDLQYLIDPSYDKARNYFEIDRHTGLLKVNLVGVEFDYDVGYAPFDIPIEVYDGVTVVAKRSTTQFQVNLIDVNDNAPVFQEVYSPIIAENSPIGTSLGDLCATDLDSGVNGEISFELLSTEPPGGGEKLNLFDIEPRGTNCARLFVVSSLETYYGTWEITIRATDHGYDDVDFGEQITEATFNVEVTPFNFNSPNIINPSSDSIRLIHEQEVGGILRDVNNDPIKPFQAEDNDGGVFGEVQFFVTATPGQDATDAEFFTFVYIDEKKSDLKLTKQIGGKTVYYITCTAVDGGEKSSVRNLHITFVNINGSPYFEVEDAFTFFKEKEAGQSESYIVPEGKDPLNEGLSEEDHQKIYYFLEKTPTAEEYFNLNRETRELKLIKQLNRNEHERHALNVILSREQENAPSDPADEAILPLTILVTPEGALTIDPSKPTIFYPVTNTLRLIDDQTVDTDLVVVGNSGLRSFEAFGRNADQSLSDIEFVISNVLGELEDAEYFTFYKVNKTSSNLRLAKEIDHPNPFNIRITAEDSTKQESESLNLKIIFVDTDRTPYFEKLNDFIFIHENVTGLEVPYPIPSKAIEPLNEGLEDQSDFVQIYYFTDSTYNSEDTSKFNLDSQTGILSLNEMLDREAQETHELRIIVSRESSGAPTNVPVDSILLLTVIVWDINDNPPVFDTVNGAGIATSDRPGKIILQVRAHDADLNETITYRKLDETFRAFGDGIDAVEPSAFSISSENNLGNIILNFIPRANMVGHFEFNIEASDNDAKHSDTALVKIYLIADANRVTFVFLNSVADFDLDDNTQFMLDLFREQFGYICNIEETIPATNENGVIIENLTNVRVIFIKDNEAIPAETIQAIASDVVFITQLKSKLAQRRLILQEVPSDSSLTDDTNKAELLQTILIVLSVVLGILCAVLIIAFFIRTRNLRRQLKAMSTVDFGSTSSNLNRREAPTTNVFSVEGSNPVLNNNNLKPVFDNVSVHSDESDFTGIHDDPTFQQRRESINPQLIEEIRRKSINPMVNGKSNGFDSNS